MSIRVTCPSCRKPYNLADAMQGKTVACRECRSSFKIPAPAGRQAEERIATTSRPAGAAGRAARANDTEPGRPPAQRRSRPEKANPPGGKSMLPILLGVGAAAVVFLGLVIAGIVVAVIFLGGSKDTAPVASSAPPPVAAGPAAPAAPVNAPPAAPQANPPAAPLNPPPAVPPANPPPAVPVPPANPVKVDEPPPAGPAPGAGLEGDLAALKGTWQSGTVRADGGGAAGTLKLSISPQPAGQAGRIRIEVATKQGGRSTTSTLNYSFTLEQARGERLLVTRISRAGRGAVFIYRFEGGDLVLSGAIASGRVAYTLKNVALRRTAAEPEMAADGNPAAPAPGAPAAGGGAKGSPAGLKISGDVFAFVAEAVRDRRLADVDIRGFTLHQGTYRDVCEEGGVLIGFEVGLGKFTTNDIVKSLRPIYLTKDGEKPGEWHGPVPATPIPVKARPGYVVSSVAVRAALGLDALTLTFAKLGKDGLDLSDTYSSEQVGGNGGRPSSINGKGALFVGATGHLTPEGAPSSLGLVAVLPK